MRPTSPVAATGVVVGFLLDLTRSHSALVVENAFLRQQLCVAVQQSGHIKLSWWQRIKLVLLSRVTATWQSALHIVQPATLLRWRRDWYRAFWRWRSRPKNPRRKPLPAETIALIREMTAACRLWGAERIRGELLKLGITVCKRTIQKYIDSMPRYGRGGSTWKTLMREHAREIWACDFVQTYDIFFRPIFAFFVVELSSRCVIQFGVTRFPTDAWVAQRLREATPFGHRPRFLIHDRDAKFGEQFNRVAQASGIRLLRTAVRSPKMNAVCERFIGSARRECMNHHIIMTTGHLHRILAAYVTYFNEARPHQGLGQQIPAVNSEVARNHVLLGRVVAKPVLGGLHYEYRYAA